MNNITYTHSAYHPAYPSSPPRAALLPNVVNRADIGLVQYAGACASPSNRWFDRITGVAGADGPLRVGGPGLAFEQTRLPAAREGRKERAFGLYPLHQPRFPVESREFPALHAPFPKRRRTRGPVQSCVQEIGAIDGVPHAASAGKSICASRGIRSHAVTASKSICSSRGIRSHPSRSCEGWDSQISPFNLPRKADLFHRRPGFSGLNNLPAEPRSPKARPGPPTCRE
jgi:hypothetical protein